jgi:hypothetical protein
MSSPRDIRKPNPESGYALLLILAMAAVVAITLYTQLPRVAFEAQRDKEQMLIDRGEQYSRAIQLFVHKFNRFPASIEELENTNNIRFLRRRYIDPMTKKEWRFLHAGPGGVITDSINSPAKKPDAGLQNTNAITTLAPANTDAPQDASGVNIGLRFRPSDQQGAVTTGAGPAPSPGTSGPVMVLPDGTIVPANPSGTAPPTVAGAFAATGIGAPGIINGPLPNGVAIQQNAQDIPPLPPQLQGPSSGAAGLINQILTTPRPGGVNGFPGGQSAAPQAATAPAAPSGTTPVGTSQPQQQVIGAGLAGVASKREQGGIKSYNDHTKYNEWEFVYDITKDPRFGRGGAAGATGGLGGAGRGGPTIPGVAPPTAGQPSSPSGSAMTPAAPSGQ